MSCQVNLQFVSLVLKLFFYNKVVYIQNASVSCLPSAPEGGINSETLFLQREQLNLKYKPYHLKKRVMSKQMPIAEAI